MAEYPSLKRGDAGAVPGGYPESMRIQTKTLISGFDDLGEEKRKLKWTYPRRHFNLRYNYITKANAKTLWDFYIARNGQYEAFSFFMPYISTYTYEYVGTGDGSTTIWSLPSKSAIGRTMYVDGAAQSEGGGADWVFSSGGGGDNEDLATFNVAPSDGERLTFSFYGYLRIRARFEDEFADFDTFWDTLVNSGINIHGLLNSTYAG